jgi:cell division protein FtsL
MNLLLNKSSILAIILLLISCFALFQIKHKVAGMRRELNITEREIIKAQESIHILKAEWSYLTQPENISKLAKKKLNLSAIASKKIRHLSVDRLSEITKILKEAHVEADQLS